MIYQLAFDTFIGARSENQDSILNIKIAEDVFLVGIADGMGGVAGGRIASTLAVESITDYIKSLSLDQFERENLKSILSSCYDIAGFSIQKAKERQPELNSMGTTLSLLLICGDMYVWSNIGDSRIYQVGEQSLDLLTVDHTLVQQLSDVEMSDLEESVTMKYEHVLTKCLDGSGETADIFPLEKDCVDIENDATFLLCSDGLIIDKSDINQSSLLQFLNKDTPVQNEVSNLISYAYSEGSKDNISVGVVRIQEGGKDQTYSKVQKQKKRVQIYNWLIYIILLSIVFISGIVFVSSLDVNLQDWSASAKNTSVASGNQSQADWLPLIEEEFLNPIDASQDIYWNPHPNKESIRYYHVVVMSENEILMEKYFNVGQNYLSTSTLSLREGVNYTLLVDAISTQDKRIEGNSVEFFYQETL